LLGVADAAVDRPVDQFGNVLEYAGIVYGKGPFFLVSLRRDIGDGAFWQGLRTYYERFRFREAGSGDLPSVLAEVSNNPAVVNALTQRWLYESHGDEDLGRPSIAAVVEPIFGPEAAALMGIFEGLLGGGGSGSGGGLDPTRVLDDVIRGLGGAGLRGLLEGILPAPRPSAPPPNPGLPPPNPGLPPPNPGMPALPNPTPTPTPAPGPAVPSAPVPPSGAPSSPPLTQT
jgi:hypothetical protein